MLRRLIPLLCLTTPALAETPIAEMVCGPRAQVMARLEKGQGAALAGSGLRDADAIIEVWATADGDWTLVQSYANGQACILAMGEGWSLPVVALPETPAPADPA